MSEFTLRYLCPDDEQQLYAKGVFRRVLLTARANNQDPTYVNCKEGFCVEERIQQLDSCSISVNGASQLLRLAAAEFLRNHVRAALCRCFFDATPDNNSITAPKNYERRHVVCMGNVVVAPEQIATIMQRIMQDCRGVFDGVRVEADIAVSPTKERILMVDAFSRGLHSNSPRSTRKFSVPRLDGEGAENISAHCTEEMVLQVLRDVGVKVESGSCAGVWVEHKPEKHQK